MKLLGTCAALLALAGCASLHPPLWTTAIPICKSLRAAETAAIEAFASRDAARMAEAYAPDATLMFTHSPALHGGEIAAALNEMAGCASPPPAVVDHRDSNLQIAAGRRDGRD